VVLFLINVFEISIRTITKTSQSYHLWPRTICPARHPQLVWSDAFWLLPTFVDAIGGT
jgi:hypothetical protein